MITIVLSEDHHLVRQGFKAILDNQSDMRIVAETGDGLEAAQLVEQMQPDVLLTDLMMPGINGLEVTRQVSSRNPDTKVLLLSMFDSEAYVLAALRAGASGYVLKDAEAGELVQAVRTVASGSRYLSTELSERAIDAYVQQQDYVAVDVLEMLTPREREIFMLAAQNLSHQEVADRLHISKRTAETHRHNLMQKLDLHSQSELIQFAFQNGLMASAGSLMGGAAPATA